MRSPKINRRVLWLLFARTMAPTIASRVFAVNRFARPNRLGHARFPVRHNP
jgi:hypothetical protein